MKKEVESVTKEAESVTRDVFLPAIGVIAAVLIIILLYWGTLKIVGMEQMDEDEEDTRSIKREAEFKKMKEEKEIDFLEYLSKLTEEEFVAHWKIVNEAIRERNINKGTISEEKIEQWRKDVTKFKNNKR